MNSKSLADIMKCPKCQLKLGVKLIVNVSGGLESQGIPMGPLVSSRAWKSTGIGPTKSENGKLKGLKQVSLKISADLPRSEKVRFL